MPKSSQAFRTISEVAQELDVPQHVLRFWESKFSQVRPMKRGGGRRYYRPEDIEVLKGIRILLYEDGFTIKGVQKVFREKGVRYVAETGLRNGSEPEAVDESAANAEADEHSAGSSSQPDHSPPAIAPEAAPQTSAQPGGQPPAHAMSHADSVTQLTPAPRAGLSADQRTALERILADLTALKERLDKYRSKRNSQRIVSQIDLSKRSELSQPAAEQSKDIAETS